MFGWLKKAGDTIFSELWQFTREVGAGTAVKQTFEHVREESRKVEEARVELLMKIRSLRDMVARDILMARYHEEDEKTKKGEGGENRFVTLMVKILSMPEDAQEKLFEDLAYATDLEFQEMLDFIEHNPLEQFFLRYWARLSGLAKEAIPKVEPRIERVRVPVRSLAERIQKRTEELQKGGRKSWIF